MDDDSNELNEKERQMLKQILGEDDGKASGDESDLDMMIYGEVASEEMFRKGSSPRKDRHREEKYEKERRDKKEKDIASGTF